MMVAAVVLWRRRRPFLPTTTCLQRPHRSPMWLSRLMMRATRRSMSPRAVPWMEKKQLLTLSLALRITSGVGSALPT